MHASAIPTASMNTKLSEAANAFETPWQPAASRTAPGPIRTPSPPGVPWSGGGAAAMGRTIGSEREIVSHGSVCWDVETRHGGVAFTGDSRATRCLARREGEPHAQRRTPEQRQPIGRRRLKQTVGLSTKPSGLPLLLAWQATASRHEACAIRLHAVCNGETKPWRPTSAAVPGRRRTVPPAAAFHSLQQAFASTSGNGHL